MTMTIYPFFRKKFDKDGSLSFPSFGTQIVREYPTSILLHGKALKKRVSIMEIRGV